MTQVLLLASIWLGVPRETPRPDVSWKLPELHDPFPEEPHPAPLPPEEQLKLHDLKPLPSDCN